METIVLDVEKREKSGKGVARQLRQNGFIPAVIYKAGSSMPIKLSSKMFSQFMAKTAGEMAIVKLKFSDDTKQAFVKDYQIDPIKGELLHVDFLEVSGTEMIKVPVHVVIKGEAIGVKRDKGVLQYGIRDIEIQCMPDKIPGHIDVDVSSLLIGQSIHVRDLNFSEDYRVLTDPDELLASVAGIKEEAAAPAEGEVAEPEVIKKGKKTEEQ